MIIAVTGYTGAGKTTAVQFFPKSWKRIDVDALGHGVLQREKVKKMLVATFGKDILQNREMSRQKLRAKLTTSSGSIYKLNRIVHPFLTREVQTKLKQLKKRNVVIDCALLKELKLETLVDYIILIDAPKNVLRKRQKAAWTKQEWKLLLQNQKKIVNPDFIVENTGTKNELKRSVEKIITRIMPKYSIVLSFLIPRDIVQKLKEIKISGDCAFDWRNSKFCHCTLKAIALCNKVPKEVEVWAKDAEKILSEQNPFKVLLKDIAQFPNAVFTHVHSQELIRLHKKLCKILPSSQPQFENEKYMPHVSLVSLGSSKANVLSGIKKKFGEYEVKEIQFMIYCLGDLNKSKIHKRYVLTPNNL